MFKSLSLIHSLNHFENSFYFLILQLEAENLPEVSHKYEISAVPTFLLFKVDNKCVPFCRILDSIKQADES